MPQSKFLFDDSGIAAQSTSRQQAPSAVRSASGHALSAPPSAHWPRIPSVVSSPALHAAISNKSQNFIFRPASYTVLLADQISKRHVRQALRDELGDVV